MNMLLAKSFGNYYGIVRDLWFTTNKEIDDKKEFDLIYKKGSNCSYEHLTPQDKSIVLWAYLQAQRNGFIF